MKLTSIELSGFRAFSNRQTVDLNADALILVGPNGYGKTSLLDGILWALSGRIQRLGEEDKNVVSIYSSSGEAYVSLGALTVDGQSLKITRSFDGVQQHLRLEIQNDVFHEEEARFKLLRTLWADALTTIDSTAALTAAITRSVYLQQDQVRQFVEADNEQQRFAAVSELVGAGRVTELQLQLDRARTAWTRVTNARAKEGETLRQRLRHIESELEGLNAPSPTLAWEPAKTWPIWWAKAQDLGVTVPHPADPASIEAPQALDAAVKQLQALRQSNERRRAAVQHLTKEIASRSGTQLPDITSLRQAVERSGQRLELAQGQLREAQALAAERRRAQVTRRETAEELRALAELALRHLTDRCPVCTQPYDHATTREHLNRLLGSDQQAEAPTTESNETTIAATAVAEQERERAAAEAALRQAEQIMAEHRSWLSERDHRMGEVGAAATEDPRGALSLLDESLTRTTGELKLHQERGEYLALALAQVGQQARKSELEQEFVAVRKEVQDLDRFISSREETGNLAGRILEVLREAASDVVEARLERIEPLLQRIYARIDPHPAFRKITFHSWFRHGRGHLTTRIDDSVANVWTESPAIVLSSSQMNALAVSVFLAFNLGVDSIPLRTAILDDPLQSLDDVNLLGLIDLLRRVKERRQLLLSTHDAGFGRLLARKLRPISHDQRTVVLEFTDWTREGPNLMPYDISHDRSDLRIVA